MSTPFDTWEARTRIALAARGVDHLAADPLVEEARQHWLATGTAPEEALGPPRQFAADAADQLPASTAVDRQGLTPGDHLSGALFTALLLAVPGGLGAAAATGTWTAAVTPASTLAVAVLAAVFLTVYGLPDALRAVGRPGLAPVALVVPLLVTVTALVTGPFLPTTPRLDVPVLVLVVASVLGAGLTLRYGGTGRDGRGRRETSPDAWFARLEGLLVGRHDVAPARAAELVAEARDHAGGDHPEAEFGAAEEYAAALGDAIGPRRGRRWLIWPRHLYFVALCLLLLGPFVTGRAGGGTVWLAAVGAVLAVAVPLVLVVVLVARRLVRSRARTPDEGRGGPARGGRP